MIHLLWAVHNHQPVGNFDFIFERAYERAYRPFLEVLRNHPGIRVSIHFTGILLDWLEIHHSDYLKEVRHLIEAGRLEVLGGGYYEPILPMLTEADRRGQVSALSDRLEKVFGVRPRGMWLAERVWEPSLVSSIADSGIEYVVLDGSHFKMVGKTESELDGYFETEDQGRRLKLIPIHDGIRDTIPFRPVEDVVGALRALNTSDRVQVVFGDDGEKFGDWPETFETVYTNGWLDRFFSALEAEPDTFAVRPLREGVDLGKSLGMIYLPPASYGEMMVWAQNPGDIPRLRATRQYLWDTGRGEEADRFLRGTFWRNFLVKYPESNRIHKQALRLSGAVGAAHLTPAAERRARNHVWQSQCNCGYWHGVFGGLYLPHLRFALYRHLIAAQKILDAKALKAPVHHTWEQTDWNYDGRDEYLLNTSSLLVAFTADGAVDQLWLKKTEINLCDTLTRRRESYHGFIVTGPTGGTKLEDQIAAKEQGLEAYLIYDRRVRENFAEAFYPADTSFESYRLQQAEPVLSFRFGEPKVSVLKDGLKIRFEGTAPNTSPAGGQLQLAKTYTIPHGGRKIGVSWKLTAHGAASAPAEIQEYRFVAETLFCLLAGNAPDRFVTWQDDGGIRRDILASHGVLAGETAVSLTDEWLRLRCGVKSPGSVAVWRDALETVSQSEGGYERVYQGSVVAPVWDVRLSLSGADKFEASMQVNFDEEFDQENGNA